MKESFREYPGLVERVIDGDTLEVRVDLGFYITRTEVFRLLGVDTPELRSPDPDERSRAQIAKQHVIDRALNQLVTVRSIKRGKYRFVAEIILSDGKSLTEELIELGYREYPK